MNTDFPLKAQDAIIGDVIIYPEMDMSRTVNRGVHFEYRPSSGRAIPEKTCPILGAKLVVK